MAETAIITRYTEPAGAERPSAPARHARRPTQHQIGRRRFVIAVLVGVVVVLPPMLWLLWDLWNGSVNPLRAVPYDNFYDMQARAIFHGHLYLPNGKEGIEAFRHGGRQYTYFGLFPSIIRMPVLLVTSSLDGKLTAPSILLAWMATALSSSLLLWRIRFMARGEALVGRAEAAAYGALMATIMGGSVVIFLAATPFVYNEDFAWSIPLTVGSLLALLGMMERPSWGRVASAGVLILSANLDRTPTGYACVIAAVLVAGWFALGKGGTDNKRWAWPIAGVGAFAFLVSCAVTYAKFGIPVGLPMADQIWTTVNAHRRYFLAANGGKAFSFGFIPSTLWAYLQPFGIHLSGLFPYITPPTAPAAQLDGAVLDQFYPTASFTATSPLLFLAGIWGLVTAFRPSPIGKIAATRVLLVAAAAGTSGVLLWGYISQRYLGDLMPLVILASGIGMVDIWRRLDGRSRRGRRRVLGAIGVLAAYCVAANIAIALWPVSQWTSTQAANFVSARRLLSIESAGAHTRTGATLPYWAPAGQLFAVGHCSGLYLSTGNTMVNVPGQQIQHYTWLTVEHSPRFTRTIGFTFNRPGRDLTGPVTLMTYGRATLVLTTAGPGLAHLVIEHSGTGIPWPSATGWSFPDTLLHEQLQVRITTDPNLSSIAVTWYGSEMLNHYLAGTGPAVVHVTPAAAPGTVGPVVSVAQVPMRAPADPMRLCHTLVGNR
ncbi:MAG: hypothetical protein ACYDDZ_02790 [Acidimicrobiales bacterium]